MIPHFHSRQAITSGFFYHTARLEDSGGYKTIKHHIPVMVHPSSCLSQELPKWVIYHELVLTSKEFMRQVISVRLFAGCCRTRDPEHTRVYMDYLLVFHLACTD